MFSIVDDNCIEFLFITRDSHFIIFYLKYDILQLSCSECSVVRSCDKNLTTLQGASVRPRPIRLISQLQTRFSSG